MSEMRPDGKGENIAEEDLATVKKEVFVHLAR
jgi:hypothetical protein